MISKITFSNNEEVLFELENIETANEIIQNDDQKIDKTLTLTIRKVGTVNLITLSDLEDLISVFSYPDIVIKMYQKDNLGEDQLIFNSSSYYQIHSMIYYIAAQEINITLK